MSPIEELTGGLLDENCLHCYLPPVIDAWIEAHPDVHHEMVLIQVAQTLGDLIGSVAPDAGCADRISVGLMRYIRDNARRTAQAASELKGH